MRAFLLAAGLATRLRPLTHQRPKQLLPLPGGHKTLLDYHLQRLVLAGISEVVINVSAFYKEIKCYLLSKSYPISVVFSEEGHTPVHTATGVQRCLAYFKDEPFLLLSSDVWTDYPLSLLIDQSPEYAHIVLTPSQYSGDFGLSSTGELTLDQPSGVFAGIAKVHPRLFTKLPSPICGIGEVLRMHLEQGQTLTGSTYLGPWMNLNTVNDYHQLIESPLLL